MLKALAALLAAALATGACTASTASSQPASGQGWTLTSVTRNGPGPNGVSVALGGPSTFKVLVTVPQEGSGGCGTPTFTGFVPSVGMIRRILVNVATPDEELRWAAEGRSPCTTSAMRTRG